MRLSLEKVSSVREGVMLVPFHPLQSAEGTRSKFPSVYFYPDVHTAGYHLRVVCGESPPLIHIQLQESTESLSSRNRESHVTVNLEGLQ